MKPSVILSLALFATSCFASAEQLYTYPADEPVFSISFPDDWEVDDEDEQALSVAPEDELVSVELIALEADEAKGAIKEAKEALAEEFEELEIDEAQKGEINKLKVTLFNAKGEDDEGNKYSINCALFAPGEGDTYFMLLFVASEEGLKKHEKSLNAILQSVKGA